MNLTANPKDFDLTRFQLAGPQVMLGKLARVKVGDEVRLVQTREKPQLVFLIFLTCRL